MPLHLNSSPEDQSNSPAVIIPQDSSYLPGLLRLDSPEATRAVGAVVGAALLKEPIAPFLVTLEGPLGAGKTTLCQGLAEAMGAEPGEAVSPTFTLCNEYQTKIPLRHIDLYRLGPNAAAEFVGAGLDECLDGLCLVEWPERMDDSFWPADRLELVFQYDGQGRLLRARGPSPLARKIWKLCLSL